MRSANPGRGELCTYTNHGPSAERAPVGSLVGSTVLGASVGASVAGGGTAEEVGNGIIVSVGETTITAGAHEIKIRAASKTELMFLTFINPFSCKLCTAAPIIDMTPKYRL
jgi:hypothetical protein